MEESMNASTTSRIPLAECSPSGINLPMAMEGIGREVQQSEHGECDNEDDDESEIEELEQTQRPRESDDANAHDSYGLVEKYTPALNLQEDAESDNESEIEELQQTQRPQASTQESNPEVVNDTLAQTSMYPLEHEQDNESDDDSEIEELQPSQRPQASTQESISSTDDHETNTSCLEPGIDTKDEDGCAIGEVRRSTKRQRGSDSPFNGSGLAQSNSGNTRPIMGTESDEEESDIEELSAGPKRQRTCNSASPRQRTKEIITHVPQMVNTSPERQSREPKQATQFLEPEKVSEESAEEFEKWLGFLRKRFPDAYLTAERLASNVTAVNCDICLEFTYIAIPDRSADNHYSTVLLDLEDHITSQGHITSVRLRNRLAVGLASLNMKYPGSALYLNYDQRRSRIMCKDCYTWDNQVREGDFAPSLLSQTESHLNSKIHCQLAAERVKSKAKLEDWAQKAIVSLKSTWEVIQTSFPTIEVYESEDGSARVVGCRTCSELLYVQEHEGQAATTFFKILVHTRSKYHREGEESLKQKHNLPILDTQDPMATLVQDLGAIRKKYPGSTLAIHGTEYVTCRNCVDWKQSINMRSLYTTLYEVEKHFQTTDHQIRVFAKVLSGTSKLLPLTEISTMKLPDFKDRLSQFGPDFPEVHIVVKDKNKSLPGKMARTESEGAPVLGCADCNRSFEGFAGSLGWYPALGGLSEHLLSPEHLTNVELKYKRRRQLEYEKKHVELDNALQLVKTKHPQSIFTKITTQQDSRITCADCPEWTNPISTNPKHIMYSLTILESHLNSKTHKSAVVARLAENDKKDQQRFEEIFEQVQTRHPTADLQNTNQVTPRGLEIICQDCLPAKIAIPVDNHYPENLDWLLEGHLRSSSHRQNENDRLAAPATPAVQPKIVPTQTAALVDQAMTPIHMETIVEMRKEFPKDAFTVVDHCFKCIDCDRIFSPKYPYTSWSTHLRSRIHANKIAELSERR